MSLAVEDAAAWWEHIQRQEFTKKYPGIMCKPPAIQPWGIRVLYLSDPTGFLWHTTDAKVVPSIASLAGEPDRIQLVRRGTSPRDAVLTESAEAWGQLRYTICFE